MYAMQTTEEVDVVFFDGEGGFYAVAFEHAFFALGLISVVKPKINISSRTVDTGVIPFTYFIF